METSPQSLHSQPQVQPCCPLHGTAYGLVPKPLVCLIIPECCADVLRPGHAPCTGQPVGRGPAGEPRLLLETGVDAGESARRLARPACALLSPQVLPHTSVSSGRHQALEKQAGRDPLSQAAGPGLARAPPERQPSAQTTCTPSCQQPGAFTERLLCGSARSPGGSVTPTAGEWVELSGWLRLWWCPGPCDSGQATFPSWGSSGRVPSMRPLPRNKPDRLTQPATLPGGDRATQLAACSSRSPELERRRPVHPDSCTEPPAEFVGLSAK